MAGPSSYPLTNIKEPHANDVLFGRGGATNKHNSKGVWRALVEAHKCQYMLLPDREKRKLATLLVTKVRALNPPGRFLKKESDEMWNDVGDTQAMQKTAQAMREGAPVRRSEVVGMGGHDLLEAVAQQKLKATLEIPSTMSAFPNPQQQAGMHTTMNHNPYNMMSSAMQPSPSFPSPQQDALMRASFGLHQQTAPFQTSLDPAMMMAACARASPLSKPQVGGNINMAQRKAEEKRTKEPLSAEAANEERQGGNVKNGSIDDSSRKRKSSNERQTSNSQDNNGHEASQGADQRPSSSKLEGGMSEKNRTSLLQLAGLAAQQTTLKGTATSDQIPSLVQNGEDADHRSSFLSHQGSLQQPRASFARAAADAAATKRSASFMSHQQPSIADDAVSRSSFLSHQGTLQDQRSSFSTTNRNSFLPQPGGVHEQTPSLMGSTPGLQRRDNSSPIPLTNYRMTNTDSLLDDDDDDDVDQQFGENNQARWDEFKALFGAKNKEQSGGAQGESKQDQFEPPSLARGLSQTTGALDATDFTRDISMAFSDMSVSLSRAVSLSGHGQIPPACDDDFEDVNGGNDGGDDDAEQAASGKKVYQTLTAEALKNRGDACPTCLDIMNPPTKAPVTLVPCGHRFCTLCTEGHLKAHKNSNFTCPYCQRPVTNVVDGSSALNHEEVAAQETKSSPPERHSHVHWQSSDTSGSLSRRCDLKNGLDALKEMRDELNVAVQLMRNENNTLATQMAFLKNQLSIMESMAAGQQTKHQQLEKKLESYDARIAQLESAFVSQLSNGES